MQMIGPQAIDLEGELAKAGSMATALRHSAALGSMPARISNWGLDHVEFAHSMYSRNSAGDAAFIVSADEGGHLVDLLACRLRDRAIATRLGAASVLGADWINRAAESGESLPLYADPIHWLCAHCVGAVIVDWRYVKVTFANLNAVSCASKALACRLMNAFGRDEWHPDIYYVDTP